MILSLIRENHLCSWFTAKSRFFKVRECYFALLIPGNWEFRDEYVQTLKCLLQKRANVTQEAFFGLCKHAMHVNSPEIFTS